MKHTLSIDLECYSSVNLAKCGVYKYAEASDFEILLFGYSLDGTPVKVIDMTKEELPEDIIEILLDEEATKWAFNATFERVCLSMYLRKKGNIKAYEFLSPKAWRCSMIWAAYMGLPLSLKGVGQVLRLTEQKMEEGKELIRYFCVPCRPTKSNGGRRRNLPCHAREKWETFTKYNARDVEVELGIKDKLRNFPVPEFVWDEYVLDQEINDRGIKVDTQIVSNAIDFDTRSKEEIAEKLRKLTRLDNPNSVSQMKAWLEEQGQEVESLNKKAIGDVLKEASPKVRHIIELRQQLAKSSVSKYYAMQNTVCEDGRAHGMFQFYGANRSGRFAGRHIQLQNLPQNHMEDLAEARTLVREGNYTAVSMLYDSIPNMLSELIRTAFVPKKGLKFIVADFSSIEARVLAWIANEAWKLDVFKNQGDVYCATAERMFHVPVEKHGKNADLRQKGKQCELACGYGGSVGALIAFGALDAGMKEEELKPMVEAWRKANPNIVKFWWEIDRAVQSAVKEHKKTTVKGLKIFCQSGMLFIELLSGRRLCYVKPRMGVNQFGSEAVTYEGIGTTKKWERIESYGPKFVENIIQGIARDLLCFAMKTLKETRIVAHVHDELIIEAPKEMSKEMVCAAMGKTPPWAHGLELKADGYECSFYMKE